MSILDTLVYNRTAEHVERLRQLLSKSWAGMTAEEKFEYTYGSPVQIQDSLGQNLYDSNGNAVMAYDGIVRGAYNYTDLNRVESAVAYVAAALVQAPATLRAYATTMGVEWDDYYDVPYDPDDYSSLTTKTDWDEEDIPSATQMTRYLSNVALILAAIPEASAAWLPDSMDGLNYEAANNIEKVLIDVDTALTALIALKEGYIRSALAVYYSGEIYSGEGDYS